VYKKLASSVCQVWQSLEQRMMGGHPWDGGLLGGDLSSENDKQIQA